mmetsp:Transcript_36995/g.111795  ORF Transcript_36995/g.111795 Transcript_36995/m.111795 type:complete len:216 (+) Transcript_36995:686-1333(+)
MHGRGSDVVHGATGRGYGQREGSRLWSMHGGARRKWRVCLGARPRRKERQRHRREGARGLLAHRVGVRRGGGQALRRVRAGWCVRRRAQQGCGQRAGRHAERLGELGGGERIRSDGQLLHRARGRPVFHARALGYADRHLGPPSVVPGPDGRFVLRRLPGVFAQRRAPWLPAAVQVAAAHNLPHRLARGGVPQARAVGHERRHPHPSRVVPDPHR